MWVAIFNPDIFCLTTFVLSCFCFNFQSLRVNWRLQFPGLSAGDWSITWSDWKVFEYKHYGRWLCGCHFLAITFVSQNCLQKFPFDYIMCKGQWPVVLNGQRTKLLNWIKHKDSICPREINACSHYNKFNFLRQIVLWYL